MQKKQFRKINESHMFKSSAIKIVKVQSEIIRQKL